MTAPSFQYRLASASADAAFSILAAARLPKFLSYLSGPEGPVMWRERSGHIRPGPPDGRFTLWVHAVSVGEVRAAADWVLRLAGARPDWRIVFSTVTPTGQAQARAILGTHARIVYFPFDWRRSVERALDAVRPTLAILVETELWPNWLLALGRRKIPVGIVNGRMSPRSFAGYRRLAWIFGPLISRLDFALVQTEMDRGRFEALGLAPERVRVTGNMKFDAVPPAPAARAAVLAALLRGRHPLWVAGSTHPGEEDILLDVFRRLRSPYPGLGWVLAPRHVERSAALARRLEREGLRCLFSRQAGGGSEPWDVLLVDEIGVLASLYEFADAVFVGGSLARRGGQNPIEAARFAKPLAVGPHVFNFQAVYDLLRAAGAAVEVRDAASLAASLESFLADAARSRELGERGRQALEQARGATDRNVDFVLSFAGERQGVGLLQANAR